MKNKREEKIEMSSPTDSYKSGGLYGVISIKSF